MFEREVNPQRVTEAEIAVVIPSYQEADSIAHPTRVASEGLRRYFPDKKGVIINADNASPDGTEEVFLATETEVPKIHITTPPKTPGKGWNFENAFRKINVLGARAVVCVDADLISITPEWMKYMAEPILEQGYDYLAPLYSRHKYDGTITNNICYPMTRMLYGVEVRQPIGGDFGFSGELLSAYLSQDVWQTDVARFGIDIWMTTTAINEGFRVAQANLGAKIHDPKDPASSLGPMFRQVVGTLFSLMKQYEGKWKAAHEVVQAPILGPVVEQEPEPVAVTLPALIQKLRDGLAENGAIWEKVLRPENMAAVRHIAALPATEYAFSPQQWAQVLFDFAVAFCGRKETGLTAQAIIDAMTPLYFGRTGGMVRFSMDMDTATFERQVVQTQGLIFEQLKPDLVRLWEGA